jgi:hypothetical protein
VRSLQRLGAWNGQSTTFSAPSTDPELRAVVLVQVAGGGPILAARRL